MTTPRVTVTMPAYNAEATIREALATVLAQTFTDFEVVVVDDGSRTPVREVLDGIDDERIRIVEHDGNKGLGPARNTALGAARSPLLAHLDSDDLWEPEYLEAVVPCLDDPAVAMAYCNVRVFGDEERIYIEDPAQHPVDRPRDLVHRNPIPGFVVVRRAAVQQVGGYAEFAWGAMDWYLYLRLAGAGWRFAYVDRVLAHYRWTDASMSRDWDKVQESNLRVLAAFMRHHPATPGLHGEVARYGWRVGLKKVPAIRRIRAATRRA